MPAKNPVIAVVLPREIAATVKRLAALRGTSKSAVIREFLMETAPVLDRVANLLDLAARADKTALKAWAKDLEQAQGELEVSALDALAKMDDMQQSIELVKPGRPSAGDERKRRRPQAARSPGQGKRRD